MKRRCWQVLFDVSLVARDLKSVLRTHYWFPVPLFWQIHYPRWRPIIQASLITNNFLIPFFFLRGGWINYYYYFHQEILINEIPFCRTHVYHVGKGRHDRRRGHNMYIIPLLIYGFFFVFPAKNGGWKHVPLSADRKGMTVITVRQLPYYY